MKVKRKMLRREGTLPDGARILATTTRGDGEALVVWYAEGDGGVLPQNYIPTFEDS